MTPEEGPITRLYGVPGAEQLHTELAACYESDIDPWHDEPANAPRVIEEWTTAPVSAHMPSGDWLITNFLDWVADEGMLDEGGFEHFTAACESADVREAAEHLRTLIGSKVTYRMAEKLVAEHRVTWNEQGDPLVDGKPLYVKRDA